VSDVTHLSPELRVSLHAASQVMEALDRMNIDPLSRPRLPWDSLHDLLGPMWPGEFWVLAAATGNGKSSMLMNLVDAWAKAGKRVYLMSLEQPPEIMRQYWAAFGLQIPVRPVLENGLSELDGKRVRDHLRWQQDKAGGRLQVLFDDSEFLTVDTIRAAFENAWRFKADVMVIDHINHIDAEGGSDYQILRSVSQSVLRLARASGISVFAGAQLHRDKEHDVLAPYLPPKPTAIQGGEVVRQVCHVALGLYRPLTKDFTTEDARMVRLGKSEIRQFLEPNTIGFHVLKHRIRGETLGSIRKLRYQHGRIVCSDTEDRLAYEKRNDI
jgi:replicative DNA helicase